MNFIKLQVMKDEGKEIVAEIEINVKTPKDTISELAQYGADGIHTILYPAKMPKNGFFNLLDGQIDTFQEHTDLFSGTVLEESQVDTWIKGGFSKVDIDTPEYWKARGYEGDLDDHTALIDTYKQAIEAVKRINKELRTAGLLTGTLKFGTYCYTLKSDKTKKD